MNFKKSLPHSNGCLSDCDALNDNNEQVYYRQKFNTNIEKVNKLENNFNMVKVQTSSLNYSAKPKSNIPLCKLCGLVNAAMRCNECLTIQLCFACDNMYHRHPKRKNHVRKSINAFETNPFQLVGCISPINQQATSEIYLNQKSPLNCNKQTNHAKLLSKSSFQLNNRPTSNLINYVDDLVDCENNREQFVPQNNGQLNQFKHIRGMQTNRQQFTYLNNNHTQFDQNNSLIAAHPSNMPIPPPRRKKQINQNSIANATLFNQLYELNENESNLSNELKAKLIIANNPLGSSCSNLNQTNDIFSSSFNANNGQLIRSFSGTKLRRFSFEDNLRTSTPNNSNLMFNFPNQQTAINYQSLIDVNNQINYHQNQPFYNRHTYLPSLNVNENYLSRSMNELILNGQKKNDEYLNYEEYDLDKFGLNSSRKRNQIKNKFINNTSNLQSIKQKQNLFNKSNLDTRTLTVRRSQSSSHLILNNDRSEKQNNEWSELKPNFPKTRLSSYSDSNQLNPYLSLNHFDSNYIETNFQSPYSYYKNAISPASSHCSLEQMRRKNSLKSFKSNHDYRTDINRNGSTKSINTNKSFNSNKSNKNYNLKRKSRNHYQNMCESSKIGHRSKSLSRCKSRGSNHSTKSSRSLRNISSNEDNNQGYFSDQSESNYSSSEFISASENENQKYLKQYRDETEEEDEEDEEEEDQESEEKEIDERNDDDFYTNYSDEQNHNYNHNLIKNKINPKKKYKNELKNKWKCKHCTYINSIEIKICEMCSKSNPIHLKKKSTNNMNSTKNSHKKKKKIIKNQAKMNLNCNPNSKENLNNNLIKKSNEKNQKLEELNMQMKDSKNIKDENVYVEITKELIQQQQEVEKELLRRLENEKKISQQNLLLEKKLKNEETKNFEQNKCNLINQVSIQNESSSLELNKLIEQEKSDYKDPKNLDGRHCEATSDFKPSQVNQQTSKTRQSSNESNQFLQQYSGQRTDFKSFDLSINQEKLQKLTKQNQFLISEDSINKSSNISKEKSFYEKQILDANNFQQQQDQSQSLISGMRMFKTLREAERKNYLAEEVEIALSFNSNQPIAWLDENWSCMKETVLSLVNNQLLTICNNQKTNLVTIDEEDAVQSLRKAKGNIWQAVDFCVKLKKQDLHQANSCGQDVKSFAFNLNYTGLGSNNADGNLKHTSNEFYFKNKYSNLEYLLNEWCNKSLIEKDNLNQFTDEVQNKSNIKVKDLILFLKQNGLFNSSTQSHQDIEHQISILINLVKKKINSNDSIDRELNDSNKLGSKTSLNDNLKNQFDQIDEKMKENLVFFEQLEEKKAYLKISNEELNKLNENCSIEKELIKFEQDLQEEDKLNESNYSEDDQIEFNLKDESLSSLETNGKLSNLISTNQELYKFNKSNENLQSKPVVIEQTHQLKSSIELEKKFNKEKSKIKIIRRKIFRRNSSDAGQSFEEVSYVDNFDEIDENLCQKLNQSLQKDNHQSNFMEKQIQENEIINAENDFKNYDLKDEQLLINDEMEKKLHQLNPNFGYARTIYECELCTSTFHINELISMLFCTHRACRNCLEKYFTIQIREKQRILIKCPFCDQPEIASDDEDSVFNYLNLLEELIKNIVPQDLYELFQQKVRDRTLQKDPSFKWCSKCCSGFLNNNVYANILQCPDCKTMTCSKCNEIWHEEHQMLTCDQYKQWLIKGDDWLAEHQLSLHMNKFGIRCPKCDFHYELSKGGCMHFHCIQCEHDFCSGCDASFKMGDKCLISANCEKLGFHAHHPRNCMFYLRDKRIEDLEKMLTLNNVDFEKTDFDKNKLKCDVIEQKELAEGLKDETCKRNVEKFGYCSLHYVEYLGSLIRKNHIDPISILNEEELINIMKRESLEIPKKSKEIKYREKLIKLIEQHSPINIKKNLK